MHIVRGLDVGFGSTKFVVDHVEGYPVQCRTFPSIAPLASQADISGGMLDRRDTVIVEVKGRHYEVGPQAELALKTHNSRVLHAGYIRTPDFLALARGAFHYMGVPHIDLLIAGLPVAQLSSRREELEQLLVGAHRLPNDRIITVRRVVAVAQPIGGFIAYATHSGLYAKVREQVNLIVDPGFFTFDWVLAKGVLPMAHRSGSFNGGVSSVLKRIAEAIGREHGIVYENLDTIDAGMRFGGFKLYGRNVPLEKYITHAVHGIDEAVNAMCNTIGDGRDIDNIVMVGGGAHLYRPAVAQRYPSNIVQIVDEPVFANVRGFQYVGEEVLRKTMERAA